MLGKASFPLLFAWICLQGCYLPSEAFTCGFLLFFFNSNEGRNRLPTRYMFGISIQNPVFCILQFLLKSLLQLSLRCIL